MHLDQLGHLERDPKNQPPLEHTTTHNPQPKITYNTITMVPPSCRLPTAPILQMSVIAVGDTIDHNHCNTEMCFLLLTLTCTLFI